MHVRSVEPPASTKNALINFFWFFNDLMAAINPPHWASRLDNSGDKGEKAFANQRFRLTAGTSCDFC
jgi:hypothetical protein